MTKQSSLFFKPPTDPLWDTWIYRHQGTFHLYYLTKLGHSFDGIGLATSVDGVGWKHHGKILKTPADVTSMGSGAVWPAMTKGNQAGKFIMNFSERRRSDSQNRQTIFFAESVDLINWTHLGARHEFCQDERWYEREGRWDNIWALRRPDGGYYGYWVTSPKGSVVALGFGESDDGLAWRAREPAVLCDVAMGPPKLGSPEVSAVQRSGDRYYALVGLDDLEPFLDEQLLDFRPGHTTFVAEVPEGPFRPALKNRRVLVGNASYFLRFLETPDGLLANHHSWEIKSGEWLGVDDENSYLAPLKRAEWDREGTLRLKWWERNDAAKSRRIPLKARLIDVAFNPEDTLILEGEADLSCSAIGLYLDGIAGKGTAFLLRNDGVVEYGDIAQGGSAFAKRGQVDRELQLGGRVRFRLIRKRRITELYVNDYLMQCYCLPELGTGRIGLVGSRDSFHGLTAWSCA